MIALTVDILAIADLNHGIDFPGTNIKDEESVLGNINKN